MSCLFFKDLSGLSHVARWGVLVFLGWPLAVHADGLPSFSQLDSNANQELSVGEFVAGKLSTNQFKTADGNNDQRITVAEYTKFKQRVADQQRRPGSGPQPPRG